MSIFLSSFVLLTVCTFIAVLQSPQTDCVALKTYVAELCGSEVSLLFQNLYKHFIKTGFNRTNSEISKSLSLLKIHRCMCIFIYIHRHTYTYNCTNIPQYTEMQLHTLKSLCLENNTFNGF